MHIGNLLLILKARWLVVFAVFIIVVGSALTATVLMPKKYEAWTTLVFDIRAHDPVSGGVLPLQLVPSYMATQAEIIRSQRVSLRVIDSMNLTQNNELRAKWLQETDAAVNMDLWLASLLQKGLEVRPYRDNSIIGISYQSTDATFAAAAANAYANAFIETLLELKVEPAKQYLNWFREQNGVLRQSFEEAQDRLSAFQRENGLVLMVGQLDIESAKLAELTRQLAVAQGQLVESSSRVTGSEAAESLPEVMQSGLIASLKTDLARLEAQHKQSLERLGENHPEVQRLASEIVSIKARVNSEIASVVSALGVSSRISETKQYELELAVNKQKERVLALRAVADKAFLLQQDVDTAYRAYEQISQRLSQISLESQNQQTNVAVLTPATKPFEPSSPKVLVNVVLSVFFGGILGVALALALEISAPKVRSIEDLKVASDLQVISSLNLPKRFDRQMDIAVRAKLADQAI